MSLNAATIELLLSKGLNGDDLLEVARAMEKKRDNTNAERQARFRENRKVKKGNARYSNAVTPPNDNTLTPGSEAKASSPTIWVRPDGVDEQVWADFLTNRKRKKRPNTASAWKDFQDDVARVSLKTGIPPPQLIAHAAAKGWAGIYEPTENRDDRQSTGSRNQQAFIGSVGNDPYSAF